MRRAGRSCRRAAWARSSRPCARRPRRQASTIRTGAAGRADPGREGPGRRRRAGQRRGASRADVVVSAINPRTTFLDLVGPREVDTGFVRKARPYPHEGRCRQAASGARPPAGVSPASMPAGPSRPAGDRALDRPCRARLQPVEIRRVLARAGDGDHPAEPRRPVARAGRRLRAVGRRAVRAL